MDKEKLTASDSALPFLKSEIEVLRKIDNPNVIKLYGVYEN
jgi:hypothetical protein